MAKKGKKLWRKSIDTKELDAAHESRTKGERQKVAVEAAPDDTLFFIDTAQDSATAAALSRSTQVRKRKREPKLLRCQTILNSAHQAKPVNPAASRQKKLRGLPTKGATPKQQAGAVVRRTDNAVDTSKPDLDLWDGKEAAPRKTRRAQAERLIKAVEVDIPGCSFNPDLEQHQEAVAEAVAAEMTKMYAREHMPKSKKVFNHMPEVDELEALLVDAEDEDEDEIAGEAVAEGQAAVAVPGRRPQEKKTQADRNREKRRRDAEEELAARRSLKKQRRELDSVKQYHVEIARQEALQAANATRRAVTKREKELTEPPRLGKHKFQPANVQVLLSEEIDGSLRRVKGTPLLAKDRFKSLQKQGLIEPRVRIQRSDRKKRATYQTGDRQDKVTAGHEATMELVKTNARRKALKK